MTTGQATTAYTNVVGTLDLSSANFIDEPKKANWDFPNFGTVSISNSEAVGTWGSGYQILKYLSDNVTLSKFTSYKGTKGSPGPLVAWPTPVDSYGNFTDYATANDGC